MDKKMSDQKNDKLFKYTCYQCSKMCKILIRDSVETAQDTISGYDDLNDCDYYFECEGEIE